MSLDVMKQALAALEAGDWYIGQLELLVYAADDTDTHRDRAKVQAAITALRAAIEQAHGDWDEVEALRASLREHMAEIHRLRAAIEQAQGKHEDWCASLTQLLLSMPPKPAPCNCKSKTASPRRWQKLTDEEIVLICGECAASHADDLRYARAIEAKLQEKNT